MIEPSSRGRDGWPWGDVYEFPHQKGEALRLERDTHTTMQEVQRRQLSNSRVRFMGQEVASDESS